MDFQDTKEFDGIQRGLQNLFQLHKTLLSEFHPDIGPAGLNQTHWRSLMYIADSGSECMTGVGRHVGLEAGSFTPVADRLITEGLVERISDSRDRRRTLLKITDTGELTVKELKRMMKAHFADKLSVLSEKQLGNLAEGMTTISEINRILQDNNNE
ncbi:MAG: hypothetical protein DRP70_12780 [Spirochaetes bacterium]|nr:MAG: hypothetical protein DRP70_12780 [Spirochaetota bacterium]RKX90161.1 MAG: hypothetical protein DRZ90_16575 [Spirochaetota bacterium]